MGPAIPLPLRRSDVDGWAARHRLDEDGRFILRRVVDVLDADWRREELNEMRRRSGG